MAGIEAAEEMTSDQLDAMAGGDLLKNEVISVNDRLNESVNTGSFANSCQCFRG